MKIPRRALAILNTLKNQANLSHVAHEQLKGGEHMSRDEILYELDKLEGALQDACETLRELSQCLENDIED